MPSAFFTPSPFTCVEVEVPIELGVAVVVHEHAGLGLGGVVVKGAAKAHLDHGVLLGFGLAIHMSKRPSSPPRLIILKRSVKPTSPRPPSSWLKAPEATAREHGILGVADPRGISSRSRKAARWRRSRRQPRVPSAAVTPPQSCRRYCRNTGSSATTPSMC